MLHFLWSGQCHTKVSRTTRVNSYWSLWSKTCEVTGVNIRRGLPKISLSSSIPPRAEGCSLFSHPSKDGRMLQPLSPTSPRGGAWLIQLPSLSIHPPRTAGLSSRFSCIAEERAWLPQPNLLFPPTTRGQRCSSQLIFSRKSPRPSSSTNSS
ncbi:unnamed protein product [Pleuronectes platessa]|uniref:Uncharacterized protein n=1 Tax=Pleuronectes platessa TaxID=8262 RepID=A0A9N7TYM4_PLEPL|nr:unnamed protein product [Pleuronectes platessa]